MLKIILTLWVAIFITLPAFAGTSLPTDRFGQLPILHEGRIKPLDSFARIELLKLAKKDTIDGQSATTWLAETLFNPGEAPNQKIFRIENTTTRHLLGLEERKKPFYSFAELANGLEKSRKNVADILSIPPKEQSKDQKDLLALHESALGYTFLLRSFSSLLPLNISVPSEWKRKAGLKSGDPVTLTALLKIQPELERSIRAIIKHKGDNPTRYTNAEQATAMLGLQLQTIGEAGKNNNLFRVISFRDSEDWASPWEIINDGKGTPATTNILDAWQMIALGWQEKDKNKWAEGIYTISERFFYDRPQGYSNFKLLLETQYNQASPFTLSIFFFAGAMVFALLGIAIAKQTIFQKLSFISFIIALIIQAIGISTRIYLLERPPVGTLYESLLFVAFIAPCIALFMELKTRTTIGLLIGSITGTMIGLLALSMAGEGDTMKMLGAVLNTRFWLTTHVLCITIGYGWCLVTSVMAHIILIGEANKKISAERLLSLGTSAMTLALFSLLFTTVGTILGGIWADQSWGRFWGWDPKENGALLIVLWLAWLIHGRITTHLSHTLWLAGMAFLSVIVAIAWIGVNLLGVGLHSYGFIEGVFWGLGLFTLLEIVLIGTLVYRIKYNGASRYAA